MEGNFSVDTVQGEITCNFFRHFMLSLLIIEQPLQPRGEGVHLADKNKQRSQLHSWI